MMRAVHETLGAVLAPDGVPLHYGDEAGEYRAALERAVVMDRSHEARLQLEGHHRLDLLHRISTNDFSSLRHGEGRPTVFTDASARILDRAIVYDLDAYALLLGEPGRGAPLAAYLRRNIFFGDDVHLTDLAASHCLFDVHGPQTAALLSNFWPSEPPSSAQLQATTTTLADVSVIVASRKPASGYRWTLVVPNDGATAVWETLLIAGLKPAGALTYNVLRIRAGLPGMGRELSADFLPLEVGLWDEVSFSKGCYTGQEVIARMESRGRLAKTLVQIQLAHMVTAPAPLLYQGRAVGQLTSSVQSPIGEVFALGVVRPAFARPGQQLIAGDEGVPARVIAPAGTHPPYLRLQEEPHDLEDY